MSSYIRKAYHGGSWYESNPEELYDTLSTYLKDAKEDPASANKFKSSPNPNISASRPPPRGIISPHAGLAHSGSTAAYAYLGLDEFLKSSNSNSPSSDTDTITVVVLHPSHHVYLDGCAISGASTIETPLCDLLVDESLRSELLTSSTGIFTFTTMDQTTDEREHSGEMQFPYIAKMFMDCNRKPGKMKVLPIMVGALSTDKEKIFGKILSSYLARNEIFTIVSSDFCHWGKRFNYAPTVPPGEMKAPSTISEIYEYIEWMDRLGMDEITSQEPGAFAKYIRLFKNTICGRHPIGVYLSALKENATAGKEEVDIMFVKYAQSSQVRSNHDSSVSYASAVIRRI